MGLAGTGGRCGVVELDQGGRCGLGSGTGGR